MSEYKFLNREHIGFLLAGKILFRRLKYYRLLEAVTGVSWIGDASEGIALAKVDHVLISPTAPNPTSHKKLEATGLFKVGPDATFEMSNTTFATEHDCFAFCFSSGDLAHLTEAMCAADKPDAYDGCVSIPDPEMLAIAIRDHGKLELDGRPIRDNFSVAIGPVSYSESVAQDLLISGMPSADPFKKDRRFAVQKEMRIVLTPIPPNLIDSDGAVVLVDKANTLFREEPLPIAKKVPPPPDNRSESELFNVLKGAVRSWSDADQVRPGSSDVLFNAMRACTNRDEKLALWQRFTDEQKRRNDEQALTFNSHRPDIIQAYWILRQKFPDTGMDDAILGSYSAFGLQCRLFRYLWACGQST